MRIDFYYDIVCPYAYLASREVQALAGRVGAELAWRPILLGGLFKAHGHDAPMNAMSPPRARLNMIDLHRQAELAGVALAVPDGHPRRSVDAMRLLIAADDDVRVALTHDLYRAYWVEGRDIADRAVLEAIAAVHGVDAARIDAPETRQALFDATAEAAGKGAFGVPTFAVDDRIWWGADRMPHVERALGGDPEPYAPKPPETPAALTFFHDFSSPYSYLAAQQIERVAAAHGATVDWRPILLGALFRDVGTADVPLFTMSPAKRRYLGRELAEQARALDVPFRFPESFPLRTITALRAALVEPALTLPIYRAAWGEGRDIGDPEVLADVIRAAGHDPDALAVGTRDPAIKARLKTNTDAAREAGACGVPTFVVDHGDGPTLFWGQDRLDHVARALDGWRPAAG